MPAPHRHALCWKLEQIIVVDGGVYIAAWDGKYVEQIQRHIQGLLA